MMTKKVTFATLENLLFSLSFKQVQTAGYQQVFQESNSETLVVLPAYSKKSSVRPVHLVAVKKTLVENGLIDPDIFDQYINEPNNENVTKFAIASPKIYP